MRGTKKKLRNLVLSIFVLSFTFSFISCRPVTPVKMETGKRPVKTIQYISEKGLKRRIANFRPVKLAHLPTPLEKMKALSGELNGPQLFIKRDDQTGLALGGNKARKLEFIIADALLKKADMVITWAGLQSNWCRQTAAAARMFGIKPVLILFKRPEQAEEYDGNLLLDFILDADIEIIEPDEEEEIRTEEIVNHIAEERMSEGYNPYVVPVGGSMVGGSMTVPLGAISYTKAFLEIFKEAKKKKIKVDHIVLATGSGGTQAGLIVGAKSLGANTKIVGISVSRDKAPVKEYIAEIACGTADALGLRMTVSPEEVIVYDDYIGEGYGILNQETADAIRLTAKKEGIILDPVYSGKAMAGLINLTRKGYFKKGEVVIFLHTGGTPALFVYKKELLELLKGR